MAIELKERGQLNITNVSNVIENIVRDYFKTKIHYISSTITSFKATIEAKVGSQLESFSMNALSELKDYYEKLIGDLLANLVDVISSINVPSDILQTLVDEYKSYHHSTLKADIRRKCEGFLLNLIRKCISLFSNQWSNVIDKWVQNCNYPQQTPNSPTMAYIINSLSNVIANIKQTASKALQKSSYYCADLLDLEYNLSSQGNNCSGKGFKERYIKVIQDFIKKFLEKKNLVLVFEEYIKSFTYDMKEQVDNEIERLSSIISAGAKLLPTLQGPTKEKILKLLNQPMEYYSSAIEERNMKLVAEMKQNVSKVLPEFTDCYVPLSFVNDPGFVYVLRNKWFATNLVKIGLTRTSVEERVATLSSDTGVPVPFDIVCQFSCNSVLSCEQLIHKILQNQRVNQRREFFNLNQDVAKQIVAIVVNFINAQV